MDYSFAIQTVTATAIMVTITAYTQGPPADSEQSAPAFSLPQGPTNNALIASFHARAATRPNAAVINAVNFSITCFFIFTSCYLEIFEIYKFL